MVDPSLPIFPAEASNGEFVPRAATAHERAMGDEILRRIADTADRLRVDRRTLLHSASGIAATLAVFNLAGCSSGGSDDTAASTSSAPPSSATTSTGPGGTFHAPDPNDR